MFIRRDFSVCLSLPKETKFVKEVGFWPIYLYSFLGSCTYCFYRTTGQLIIDISSLSSPQDMCKTLTHVTRLLFDNWLVNFSLLTGYFFFEKGLLTGYFRACLYTNTLHVCIFERVYTVWACINLCPHFPTYCYIRQTNKLIVYL